MLKGALFNESKLVFINVMINGYITGKLRIAIRLKLCPARHAIAATIVRTVANPNEATTMISIKCITDVTGDPNNSQKEKNDPNPVISNRQKLKMVFDTSTATGDATV